MPAKLNSSEPSLLLLAAYVLISEHYPRQTYRQLSQVVRQYMRTRLYAPSGAVRCGKDDNENDRGDGDDDDDDDDQDKHNRRPNKIMGVSLRWTSSHLRGD